MKQTHLIHHPGAAIAVAAALSLFLAFGTARADTVKLKDGRTLEGVITLEADEILKIKVQKSATISETVTLSRSEIAEVVKSAPDDVDLAKMKQLLPTPSLVTTSGYRSIIEKGPQAFLNSYPESRHRAAVEEIKKELEDELAKVDRGFIKLEGEWITPKHQQDFRELVDARILNLGMRQKAEQGNFIGALQDFERMEENYFGTPSYLETVKSAQQLLPVLGQRLQRMVTDVEFLQKQFEENLQKMTGEVERQRVIDARKREEAALKQRVEADKATGVRWYQVNQRSKDDLNAYIELVRGEIERLQGLDLVALKEQADQLVKADGLVAEGKLTEAREILGMKSSRSGRSRSGSSGGKYNSGYGSFGKAGSSRRSPRSSSGVKQQTSYLIALQEKISAKEKALTAAREQAEAAAEGAAATAKIRSEDIVRTAVPPDSPVSANGDGSSSAGEPTTRAGATALVGLAASKPPETKEPDSTSKPKPKPKPKSKKSGSSSSKKKSADDDEDEDAREEKRPQQIASGGIKLSFQKIIIIVAVLLAITVGIMKMLGLGGAKAD